MNEEPEIREERKPESVPYIVYESEMARMERIVKRLWITIFVCLAIIAGMFIYEVQFVDESWSFESTTDGGGNAIANGDGEVYYYGTGEGNAQNQNP